MQVAMINLNLNAVMARAFQGKTFAIIMMTVRRARTKLIAVCLIVSLIYSEIVKNNFPSIDDCPGFTCDDGNCISKEQQCNGYNDCTNGEDEDDCSGN